MEAVSVVVSIRMRKMFTEVRKMFLDARLAEQDVRETRVVRTSKPNSCSEAARDFLDGSHLRLRTKRHHVERFDFERLDAGC